MDDVLGYGGKRAVVTGCASGMGEATARILVDVGAEVIGLDVKPTAVPVDAFHTVDLKDPASIDAAVEAITGDGTRPVDAVFSVAGLPGPPFSDLDTVLVNFVGARHLIEGLVPSMPRGAAAICVASNAGLGWQQELDWLVPAISTDGFAAGKAWAEANPELINSGYVPSKKLVNAWVAWRGVQLMADRGIRLNCANPGPTNTAMMPAFEALAGADLIDAFIGPSGRRSTPEEQAWPLVFMNSPRSSYIAGEAIHTDAGFLAAMTTGQLQ